MEIQNRHNHAILYLAVVGAQSIRIPRNTPRELVTRALAKIPPGSHDRRRRSIRALILAGIDAR